MPNNIEKEDGLRTPDNAEITNSDNGTSREKTIEERLQEAEFMMEQLKSFGIKSQSDITEEDARLESEFAGTLSALKEKLGDQEVSKSSERMIHEHMVDEVVDFHQKVFDRYEKLVKLRQDIDSKENIDPVLDAAREASTVRDFSNKLGLIAVQDGSDSPVKEAAENISDIIGEHGKYKVEEDLRPVNGMQPAGITQMEASGGGEVTIEANHLVQVGSDEGKKEVRRTLEHEAIHGNQARLRESQDGTVIVDPQNDRPMTEIELHEGGAMHGTKDLDGKPYTNLPDVYTEGSAFYKRNDPKTINEHVEKDGDHAGDRVHLQAALAKEAGITDKKKLIALAEKAGFSEIEIKRFLKLMEAKEEESSSMPLAA